MVHCQFAGRGPQVLSYLARYVTRTALSSKRLLDQDEAGITFSYRESKANRERTLTLSGDAFLHRFLQHVLPKGHAGLEVSLVKREQPTQSRLGMDRPTLQRLAIALCATVFVFGQLAAFAATETRTWVDTKGAKLEAEYISSTADSVTLRRTDGLAVRWKLGDLSEADRAFVEQKQSAEKGANMIDAVLKGEIVWRLPAWNSLSWSNTQPAEIWLWDDKSRTATEKVATVKVQYTSNQRNRNQFEGTFKTEQPVHIPKNARVLVKAKFKTMVNGKDKELEEPSAPMSLPALNKGEIKLPAVRVSITR